MPMPVSRLTPVVLTGLLAACTTVTPIGEILTHPRDYAEKTVTVRGEVRSVFSLLFVKYFTLDDGTGTIAVVTERPLPNRGERLEVTGTVKEAFSLGDQTLTLIVERAPAQGTPR
ncbi:OB-fold nucleic acid binding domain-containing protein [Thiobacter aerophilum]|uniref:OB-fold nucleic acid binding domain-containing protein n=1 Tax=Thiobacter aerophilum TaxID=3121275 RepID=A0ABV0EDU9_9BURK